MTDDQIPAAEAAGDDDVRDDAATVDAGAEDEREPETGAAEEQAPEGVEENRPTTDAAEGDDMSPAARRREQRKRQQEALRQRAEEASEEARKHGEKLAAIQAAAEADAEPQEADFDDYGTYQVVKAIWGRGAKSREAEAEKARQAQEAANQRRREAQGHEWRAKVEDAKDQFEDFERVVFSPNFQPPDAVTDVILSSDVGPALAYHLASNPAEAARIGNLPPLFAAREMGRLEAKLSAPKARTETKAPPPVKPVRPNSGSAQKSPGEMTPDEYRAYREAE